MQELERMINIYHTAFIVFLILTIVFLAVSIFLFFKFNIRGIFDMRTGRGARKTIQKMQEMNAQTGKLRQDVVNHTPVHLSAEDRISAPVTEKRSVTPPAENRASAHVQPPVYAADDGSQRTEVLSGQGTGTEETALLQGQGSEETTLLQGQGSEETTLLQGQGSEETTLLSGQDSPETTVLSSQPIQETPQPEQVKLPGAFTIEKEIMWVHTEEVI